MTPAGRRQRQREEIRAAAEGADTVRAVALAREHLAEFPDDDEVRELVADGAVNGQQ